MDTFTQLPSGFLPTCQGCGCEPAIVENSGVNLGVNCLSLDLSVPSYMVVPTLQQLGVLDPGATTMPVASFSSATPPGRCSICGQIHVGYCLQTVI